MSTQEQQQEQIQQTEQVVKPKIISFDFRATGMGAYTKTFIIAFASNENTFYVIQPRYRRRSKSGNHGEDIYTLDYLLRHKIVAIARVNISNSGKHYCSLAVEKSLPTVEKAKVIVYIQEHVHDCPEILRDVSEIDIAEYLKSIAR